MEHYWVVLCSCTHTEFFFFFPFPAGFTQGHDTFLKGFGSPGLIIPSIIQWLAGRWSEAMNKANLWAYELWQYKHTILALISSVHAWNYTTVSWKWKRGVVITRFAWAELSNSLCAHSSSNNKVRRGSESHTESQPNSCRSELIAAQQVSSGGLSFTFCVGLCDIMWLLF